VDYFAFEPRQVFKAEKSAAGEEARAQPSPEARAPAEATDERIESPATAAVRELLAERDVMVPTGEIDADGNAVLRSGREIMAEQDAAIAKAENDAKGFEAAVTCFLTRGVEDAS